MLFRFRNVLAIAAAGLATAPLLASGLTPISQTRSIAVQAEASGATGGDLQQDARTAPDFNPFSDTVNTGATWNDPNNSADASASADQTSEILGDGIMANGTADASATAFGPLASANGSGDSSLQVTFSIAQLCTFSVDADLNGFVFEGPGDGTAGFILEDGGGNWIAFDEVQNDSRFVSIGGVLPPGTYTFHAYAFAAAFADNFSTSASGSASFDVNFQLTEGGCLGVNFESQPVGMQYGGAVGQLPGDLAFSESGIDVRVEFFSFLGGGGLFNVAHIDPAFGTFGSGRVIRTNNINLGFDLASTPNRGLEIEIADLGGTENIQVDGAGLFIGEITAAPAAIAPGITLSVLNVVAIPGGYQATLRLDGRVQKLVLGGQEFWMDNLCILPPCPGDTDGDGDVDISDLATVLGQFGLVGGGLAGDVDFDGDVDLSDLGIVLANFGNNCP